MNEQPSINLRASRMPLFMKCVMSAAEGDGVAIDEHNSAADLGTAVHRMLSLRVQGLPVPDVAELADETSVDPSELGMLYSAGCKIWGAVEQWFPDPICDTSARVLIDEATSVSGSLDVASYIASSRTLRVLDWKSGRVEKDHRDQLLTYAALLLEYWPGQIEHVQLFVGLLRKWSYETVTFTVAEIKQFVGEIKRKMQNEYGVFSPGTHCMECPHQHTCPGYDTHFKSIIGKAANLKPIEMTPEMVKSSGIEIANTLAMLSQMNKYAENLRAHLRSFIAEHGVIPTVNGMALKTTVQQRSEIDVTKAVEAMRSVGLNDVEMHDALKVSKDAMVKLVTARAKRGDKSATAKKFLADLEQAGGITYKPTVMLTEGVPDPTPEQKESESECQKT